MKEINVRQMLEDRERSFSAYASRSTTSKGRKLSENKSALRTEFQRDRDRIIHTKAFRRLNHKTQVFISPIGDHYTTRLTHTLEVSQIARTIARALNLNEDLTEAIALGHDMGHAIWPCWRRSNWRLNSWRVQAQPSKPQNSRHIGEVRQRVEPDL